MCSLRFIITSILAQCVSVPDPVNSLLRGYDGYDGYYVLRVGWCCDLTKPQQMNCQSAASDLALGSMSVAGSGSQREDLRLIHPAVKIVGVFLEQL